jgi:serine/threonine protein kinase
MVQKSTGPQETEKAWDIEARALNAINQLNHPHIMKSIAAIRRGESRYFMFPWAEDSLRDYWNTIPTQSPNPKLIREAICQLSGLADALDRLHNFQGGRTSPIETYRDVEIRIDSADDFAAQMKDDDDVDAYRNPMSQESIRHGDLKPENILRFLEGDLKIGTLKLGDMGLAKRHVAATEKRRGTSMRYGTRRYEGPETMNASQGRSRLYDLWSMGCITFEFIIWLLYGNDALVEFYSQAERSSSPSEFQYYKLQETGAGLRRVVNPLVISWMDHMQREDPECQSDSNSMLKDLLHIVREKLLIVDLPPTRGSALGDGGGGRGLVPAFIGGRTKYRATAAEFCKALDVIRKQENVAKYVYTGQDRSAISLPPPSTYRNFLDPLAKYNPSSSRRMDSKIGPLSTGVMQRTISADYSLPPLESWEFAVDNKFAAKAIKHLTAGRPQQYSATCNKLCNRCSKLNFWSSGFAIEDDVDALAKSAVNCDLCKLLRDASCGTNSPRSEKIRFERTQSVITVTGNTFPVLSLIRSPGKPNLIQSRISLTFTASSELVTPIAIQVGRPELPDLERNSINDFFNLAQEWLKDCDEGHTGCQVQRANRLPTRLIDVGSLQSPVLRLVETRHETVLSPRYIALSHPWGDTDAYKAFVTLRDDQSEDGRNLAKFKVSIPYDDLPKTFKHAVDCTRNLGVRYLWIDSICIIQGQHGDFADEAKRMEDVYSGAYCVVAASRAGDQRDGFLGARPQRQYVTFQPEKPFYVCQIIDRFNEDVIMGPLSQRGWVLQERALARRTIYFTENQTYFECGNGVRCETLTKLHKQVIRVQTLLLLANTFVAIWPTS